MRRNLVVNGSHYVVTFDTDNAAFDDDNFVSECGRIINNARERIENGETDGRLMDINGNTVGKFFLS